MTKKPKVVTLNSKNYKKYGCPCFLNPKHEAHLEKLKWLKNRFREGMVIKVIYIEDKKKGNAFIEYTDGKNAWRPVDAKGYMFIHCIWVSPNKFKNKGNGSLLIKECIDDAKKKGMLGVAVVTSEGGFMAGKGVFEKNGFKSIDEIKPLYHLMVKSIKKGPIPKFKIWEKQLAKYKGLHIVYSKQCPWIIRSIEVLADVAKKNKLKLKVKELKTVKQAQNAPCPYGTFCLINDGKILADHYISKRRFENIIKKDIRKK